MRYPGRRSHRYRQSWAEVSWLTWVVLRPPAALVEAALIWAALRFCTWAVVRLDNVVPPAATRLLIAEVEMLETALVEIACRPAGWTDPPTVGW